MITKTKVAIVGAGPSGLRAAAELAPALKGGVLVLDREAAPGGIPRHCHHPGYGIRDLHRFMTGPKYARLLSDRARQAGADIVTHAMVTGWTGAGALCVTSPEGRYEVAADAVILATGARERPRSARRIPGDRPAGVYTTGQLQNLVYLHHRPERSRAVIVGGELVSWSAVLTLRHAGCRPVLMTTQYAASEAYRLFTVAGGIGLRVPVAPRTKVVRVIGHGRVTGVEVEDLQTGQRRVVECDTVVFTGDWIPDHELARSAGIALDPATLGPSVDTRLRTDRDGVFAIGNLVHPVDTADCAALDGAHVAEPVLGYLRGERTSGTPVPLVAGDAFAWVSPTRCVPGDVAPARGFVLAWPTEVRKRPTIVARQGGSEIGRVTTSYPVAPGRVYRIPWTLLAAVNPAGGTVTIDLVR
ncbi:MAG: NAD(P)/FAD-dependent oxidoreductase [Propionibacteriaceae bacterium]|jgi:thioredoxin reductase|nr:NAD(P)/FAD-dependent oxidoreductase [Propionibacteriaceae bacterium]